MKILQEDRVRTMASMYTDQSRDVLLVHVVSHRRQPAFGRFGCALDCFSCEGHVATRKNNFVRS